MTHGAALTARYLLYLTEAMEHDAEIGMYSMHMPAHATLARLLSFLHCHFGLDAVYAALSMGIDVCRKDLQTPCPEAQDATLAVCHSGLDGASAVGLALEKLSAWPLRRIAFGLQARVGLWRRNGYKASVQLHVYMDLERARNGERDLYLLQLRAMHDSGAAATRTLTDIVSSVFQPTLPRQWLAACLLNASTEALFPADDSSNSDRVQCFLLLRDLLLLLLAVVDDDALMGASPQLRRQRFALCLLALRGEVQHKLLARRLYTEDLVLRDDEMRAVLDTVADFVPQQTQMGIMREGAYCLKSGAWSQVAVWFAALKLESEGDIETLAENVRRGGHRAEVGRGAQASTAPASYIDATPDVAPLTGQRAALRPFLTSQCMVSLAVRVLQLQAEVRGESWHSSFCEGLALRLLTASLAHMPDAVLGDVLAAKLEKGLAPLVASLTLPAGAAPAAPAAPLALSIGDAIVALAKRGPTDMFAPALRRVARSPAGAEGPAQAAAALLETVAAARASSESASPDPKRPSAVPSKADRQKVKLRAKQAKLMANFDRQKAKFLTSSPEKKGAEGNAASPAGSEEAAAAADNDTADAAGSADERLSHSDDEGEEGDACAICQQKMVPNNAEVVLLCSDARVPVPLYVSMWVLHATATIIEPYGPETPSGDPQVCAALSWISCGHKMHMACLTTYLQRSGPGQMNGRALRTEQQETACPVCRRRGAPSLAWMPAPPPSGMVRELQPHVLGGMSLAELKQSLSVAEYWRQCGMARDGEGPGFRRRFKHNSKIFARQLAARLLGKQTPLAEELASSFRFTSSMPPGLK